MTTMNDLTLRIAARYKSKKKVKTKDGDDMVVYEYSDKQIANRNKAKAKKVEKLSKSIGELRSKYRRDMKSSDPEKMLTALVVALMDSTFERVGNDGSADDGHFGVTGWQRQHMSFGRDSVTVKYVGKSGVKHTKKVTDSGIRNALRDAYEAVEEDDAGIFAWDGGSVTADKVNEYLKPFDITAKDIRGYHANNSMAEELRAERKKGGKLPEDKKERTTQLKEEFKAALERTAEAVGHEASTLKSQYLVPNMETDYLMDGSVSDRFDKSASMAGRVVLAYLKTL